MRRSRLIPLPAKPHKYGAKAVVIDGVRFASTKEGRRYLELRLLERVGAVTGLELQPRFQIDVCSPIGELVKVCTYVADFRYVLHSPGGLVAQVIEDVKGMRADNPSRRMYLLKKKMAEAQYGIQIREV